MCVLLNTCNDCTYRFTRRKLLHKVVFDGKHAVDNLKKRIFDEYNVSMLSKPTCTATATCHNQFNLFSNVTGMAWWAGEQRSGGLFAEVEAHQWWRLLPKYSLLSIGRITWDGRARQEPCKSSGADDYNMRQRLKAKKCVEKKAHPVEQQKWLQYCEMERLEDILYYLQS